MSNHRTPRRIRLGDQALTLRNARISRLSSLSPDRRPIKVSVATPVIRTVSLRADGSLIKDDMADVKTDITAPEELLS